MFHAIVVHSTFPSGQVVQHHTKHRTLNAAARSLSTGITASRAPGPGHNTYCGIVSPDGTVMSLRQAQGKADGVILWDNLASMMRQIAAF